MLPLKDETFSFFEGSSCTVPPHPRLGRLPLYLVEREDHRMNGANDCVYEQAHIERDKIRPKVMCEIT